jgi:hypothetical protein
MTFDEESGTTVVRRPATYRPPRSWRTWLLGHPLATADAEEETIGKKVGLAVFASDAISSTAYATEEILVILALAGIRGPGSIHPHRHRHRHPAGHCHHQLPSRPFTPIPTAAAPTSSPATTWARLAAQVAGAALLTDYILTVAVSISSGVAQIISAFPRWPPSAVLAVAMHRLRDVDQSARRARVWHDLSPSPPTSSWS